MRWLEALLHSKKSDLFCLSDVGRQNVCLHCGRNFIFVSKSELFLWWNSLKICSFIQKISSWRACTWNQKFCRQSVSFLTSLGIVCLFHWSKCRTLPFSKIRSRFWFIFFSSAVEICMRVGNRWILLASGWTEQLCKVRAAKQWSFCEFACQVQSKFLANCSPMSWLDTHTIFLCIMVYTLHNAKTFALKKIE